MYEEAANLKRLLAYLDIKNARLAKELILDASLISRWLHGHRQLKLSSEVMEKLSKKLLDEVICANALDWLRRQMELDGLMVDCESSDALQDGLKLWLATDMKRAGRALRLPFGRVIADSADGVEHPVKTGHPEIAMFIEKTLGGLPDGSQIGIHLSSEDTGILLHEAIRRTLLDSMKQKGFQVRLLISLASDTAAMSRLLSHYIQAIIEGSLSVSVVHGMTQAITNQATILFAEEAVFIVCETPKNIAPPIGTVARDECFIRECRKSFERVYNYSQPLLQRYNDNYSRNILEILYQEFAMPGNLDIMKDSINPMYMTPDAYDRFLKICGHRGEQFKWRSAEFIRFKSGMDENLKSGTVFREILSLDRLNQIAEEGKCKMPALYFMDAGIVYLDAAGCLSILEGYIDYLERVPNFNMLILENAARLNESNCWQLKHNSHIAINGWSKDEHIILHSNQLMLTHEFQTYFNSLWDKGQYSEGRRRKTVVTLQEISDRLKRNHLLT